MSSYGSDFNYDYMVSLDENVRPIEYNYRNKEEMMSRGEPYHKLEDLPGFSVFKLEDGKIYHTYSTYGRGLERIMSTYSMLDMTPLGRQDGPLDPTNFKRNYEYEEEA